MPVPNYNSKEWFSIEIDVDTNHEALVWRWKLTDRMRGHLNVDKEPTFVPNDIMRGTAGSVLLMMSRIGDAIRDHCVLHDRGMIAAREPHDTAEIHDCAQQNELARMVAAGPVACNDTDEELLNHLRDIVKVPDFEWDAVTAWQRSAIECDTASPKLHAFAMWVDQHVEVSTSPY